MILGAFNVYLPDISDSVLLLLHSNLRWPFLIKLIISWNPTVLPSLTIYPVKLAWPFEKLCILRKIVQFMQFITVSATLTI